MDWHFLRRRPVKFSDTVFHQRGEESSLSTLVEDEDTALILLLLLVDVEPEELKSVVEGDEPVEDMVLLVPSTLETSLAEAVKLWLDEEIDVVVACEDVDAVAKGDDAVAAEEDTVEDEVDAVDT